MTAAGMRVGPFVLTQRRRARAGTELWEAQRADGSPRPPQQVVVRLAMDGDAQGLAAVRREHAHLRAVDDPRIPEVFGWFEGHRALVLERVEGPSLAAVVRLTRGGVVSLDLPTALDIVVELVSGLASVHRHEVDGVPNAHGYLDPSRVRLSAGGAVKVLGLGVPPDLPDERYLAPEQLVDGPVTPRTDQWQVGALLYLLVTGEDLVGEGPRNPEVWQRQGAVDRRVDPLVPRYPALSRVLRRCLRPSSAERYPSDGELLQAVLSLSRGSERPSARRGLPDRVRSALHAPPPRRRGTGSEPVDMPRVEAPPPPPPPPPTTAPEEAPDPELTALRASLPRLTAVEPSSEVPSVATPRPRRAVAARLPGPTEDAPPLPEPPVAPAPAGVAPPVRPRPAPVHLAPPPEPEPEPAPARPPERDGAPPEPELPRFDPTPAHPPPPPPSGWRNEEVLALVAVVAMVVAGLTWLLTR